MRWQAILSRALPVLNKLNKIAEDCAGLSILDMKAYCSCGESSIEPNFHSVSGFMKRHTDQGHKVNLEVLLRLRVEVHPETGIKNGDSDESY